MLQNGWIRFGVVMPKEKVVETLPALVEESFLEDSISGKDPAQYILLDFPKTHPWLNNMHLTGISPL